MPKFTDVPFFSRWLWPMLLIAVLKRLRGTKIIFWKMTAKRRKLKTKKPPFANYQPNSQDVIATVYSKSGTNWVLQTLQQLVTHGEGEYEHIHSVVAWPEGPFDHIAPLHDQSLANTFAEPFRVIKTALPTDMVPYSPEARYVPMIRDPKEVAVSGFHFFLSVFGMTGSVSIDKWVNFFCSEEFIVGDWAKHTAGYWDWRDRPNVLFLTFNDMRTQREIETRKLMEFLNLDLSEEVFERVMDRSSFAYMKINESRFAPPRMPLIPKKRAAVMMRSGKKGNSKELLSQAHRKQIDTYFQKRLKELGSDFPYAEYFL